MAARARKSSNKNTKLLNEKKETNAKPVEARK